MKAKPRHIEIVLAGLLLAGTTAAVLGNGMVLRQPALTVNEWRIEIRKMQSAFGAPIPADQVDALARYLGGINGRKSDSKPSTVDNQAS
jgi:hypothetical protein